MMSLSPLPWLDLRSIAKHLQSLEEFTRVGWYGQHVCSKGFGPSSVATHGVACIYIYARCPLHAAIKKETKLANGRDSKCFQQPVQAQT